MMRASDECGMYILSLRYVVTISVKKWPLLQVKYEATKEGGFKIIGGTEPEVPIHTVYGPIDSVAVQRAKAEHALLFEQIAARNAQPPLPPQASPPTDTRAVQKVKAQHANLRAKIQQQHDRIAAAHARLHKEQADIIIQNEK